MRRYPVALAPLVFALATTCADAGSAHASSEPEIPPECGSRDDFDAALKQRLGNDAPLSSVHVSIAQAPGRFHLRVQIGSELRELDDANCAELFRAAVVVAVAMLMHDEQRPAPAPPAPRPLPARQYPLFSLAAGGGLSIGTLPKPVPALELESQLFWKYWGVGGNLRYYAPAEHLDAQDKGVTLHAFGAGITGIFRPSRLWQARLGFAAQQLSGQGTGSITHRQGDSAWAAGPTLGLGLVPIQHGTFWAGLSAEGQLNLARGRFEILHYSHDVANPSHEIYAVPGLAGSAFVRLGLVW